MSKNMYYVRKEKGLCVSCGKEKENPDKVQCNYCREKSSRYQKETRSFYKNLGMCPRCGKNKLFGGEKECPECIAKMYELNKRSREQRNFYGRDYYKKRIAELKENGICRGCYIRKVEEGKTYCSLCLAKKRIRNKERRRKKDITYLPRSERPSYGLCYTCGKRLDRDGNVCISCSEKLVKNLPENRGGNRAWRKDNQFLHG